MNNIDEILQQALILEGLARTLSNRDDADARALLYKTIATLQTLIQEPAVETSHGTPAVDVSEPSADEVPESSTEEVSDATAEASTVSVTTEDTCSANVNVLPETTDISTEAAPEQIRLDELLSRREAKDLRKAFTLNDKFRFRRELFCNNDPLFISTLDTLQQMSTLEEALEYLRDTMGWDLEDEEVADFVAIITNHYL